MPEMKRKTFQTDRIGPKLLTGKGFIIFYRNIEYKDDSSWRISSGVLCLLFAAIIIPTVLKDPLAFVYDYPPAAVDWFDALVIDFGHCTFWKRMRMSGSEDLDSLYRDFGFHAKMSCIGMVLGLLPCAVSGLLALAYHSLF